MNCALCHSESIITNSRPRNGTVARRRECTKCRHRWTTYEIEERAFKRVQLVERAVAELAAEAEG
jgi:transcriptional regulator NrdR family protein